MKLFIVGINSKIISEKEVLKFVSNYEKFLIEVKEIIFKLRQKYLNYKIECSIISTCLRYEILIVIVNEKNNFYDDVFNDILDEFKLFLNQKLLLLDISNIKNIFFVEDYEAIYHLFFVMCGFDSNDIGEFQVLNQIKDSYFRCLENNLVLQTTKLIYEYGLRCVSYIRNQIPIFKDAKLISEKILKRLYERMTDDDIINSNILIVGKGEIINNVYKKLKNITLNITLFKNSVKLNEVDINKYNVFLFYVNRLNFYINEENFKINNKNIIIFDLSILNIVSQNLKNYENIELITLDELITSNWSKEKIIKCRKNINTFYEKTLNILKENSLKYYNEILIQINNIKTFELIKQVSEVIKLEFNKSLKKINHLNYKKKLKLLEKSLIKKIIPIIKREKLI